MSETHIIVDLEPVGRRVDASTDVSLLQAAQDGGVELVSVCGGVGLCSGCRVRVIAGRVSPPTGEEEAEFSAEALAAGWRLACQAYPLTDVRLDIPPESLTAPQRLQVEGEGLAVAPDPVVVPVDLHLGLPTLNDLRADDRRLADALARPHVIGVNTLARLARVIRESGGEARLALRGDGHIAAALAPGTPLVGLAVDIGTTSLAAYLVDLESGATLAKAGAMNPQIATGEDVISRIRFAAEHADGAARLQARLVEALNGLIDTLCAQTGIAAETIVEVVLVGNTVMHHLALGLPVMPLGEAPYTPVGAGAITTPAARLGLKTAPDAAVYLPPNIAGYVGADHVAALIASGIGHAEQTTLVVNIGTNTEMTLAHEGRLWSCSCASGPAFEGAHIRHGMRAAPGAIERVHLLDDQVRIQTIGGQAAVGICGSGILDAVAVMAQAGIIDERGTFVRTHPLAGEQGLVLAAPGETAGGGAITVDRRDVAEIQLAKAAIRAGIDVLVNQAGIDEGAIESFIIAGAFGTYIALDSAVRVGMFPALPASAFRQVGNAAGMGACHLLISGAQRREAAALVERIDYIELTTHTSFQELYIARMPV